MLSKAVVKLSMKNEYLEEFKSLTDAKINSEFKRNVSIKKCCDGELDSYLGFKWMYLSDYEKLNN